MEINTYQLWDDESKRATDVFQEILNNLLSARFRIEAIGDIPLCVRMKTYSSMQLGCADIWFSPHKTSLMSGAGHSNREQRFLLSLQASGRATVEQGGREVLVQPGNLFLVDPARPFSIQTEEMQTRSVYISSDLLREVLPEVDGCTAVVIGDECGAGRILRGVVEELFELAPKLDDVSAGRFVAMIPHAIAVAMGQHLKRPSVASSNLEIYHRERIRNFVKQNLRDSNLSCAIIARAVNLSSRHVHALFACQEKSLMRWIWGERLERARRDIANPCLLKRQIATIAYDWGFSDPAHFSRAFKCAYGMSPREYRMTVLAERAIGSPSASTVE